MISAENYYTVYLILVTIVTLAHVIPYSDNDITVIKSRIGKIWPAFFFTILITIFIGLRPISYVFGDMPFYADAMVNHQFEGLPITWDSNYLFQPMMGWLSSMHVSKQTPIIVLAIINFGCTFVAMRKLFPRDLFLAMLVFFGAFCTFGGAVNGLKAGCASALFMVAIAYREKKLISILFLFLSMGFHHSMQLPIIAYIACSVFKNTKVYLAFWIICLILAVAHVTSFMSIFASYTDEKGADYLLIEAGRSESQCGGKLGFRYDFVLYSIVPIVLGYITLFQKNIISKEYIFILNYYLITNAIWMLCMYAQYTNRIAGLSWIMYPILMIYPFMKLRWSKNQLRVLYYVVLGHLGFTLFMHFIF